MSRQKCQVILFVGMDAQVLKIPDYDTPENWILLRYIRDELWQLIEFCRLLTILGWILGQLLKKLSALLCTLHRFNVHTYNEAKVYGNQIGLLTEQLDTSAKISMLSLIREDLQNIRLLMLHYFKVTSFISWWLGCLPVTRLGLWRLMYHSWHKLHFYKKNQTLQNMFLIFVPLRWHRASVACKNRSF